MQAGGLWIVSNTRWGSARTALTAAQKTWGNGQLDIYLADNSSPHTQQKEDEQ